MAEFNKFGFYEINASYLKYLYDLDDEVYYNKSYADLKKPFVGVLVEIVVGDWQKNQN